MWIVMCFSAEANLVAGLVIIAVGIDALRHVRHRREIALAALPALFGLHQLVEMVVWWGLDGGVGDRVFDAAVWIYVAFAFGVLPWLVGLSVTAIEPVPTRRHRMLAVAAAGGVLAGLLMGSIPGRNIGATDGGFYVDYHTGIPYGGQLAVVYVAVTCIPLMFSSYRHLMVFGAVNLLAVGALTGLVMHGAVSLWCGWAAVTSVVIALHLRRSADPLGAASLTQPYLPATASR